MSEKRTRISKALVALGGALIATAPATTFAHDNIGGDELAASNWMLIGAMVTIALGILAGVWAMRSGQFNNIEESKYKMLELSDDYDSIMSEVDRRERAEAARAQGTTGAGTTGDANKAVSP